MNGLAETEGLCAEGPPVIAVSLHVAQSEDLQVRHGTGAGRSPEMVIALIGARSIQPKKDPALKDKALRSL
jgi:hypothetical protein